MMGGFKDLEKVREKILESRTGRILVFIIAFSFLVISFLDVYISFNKSLQCSKFSFKNLLYPAESVEEHLFRKVIFEEMCLDEAVISLWPYIYFFISLSFFIWIFSYITKDFSSDKKGKKF